MSTISNSTLGNFLLLTAISASTIYIDQPENDLNMRINEKGNYKLSEEFIGMEGGNSSSRTYNSLNDVDNLNTIIDFTEKIIQNSKDLDQEYVNIVNDNFWDLI